MKYKTLKNLDHNNVKYPIGSVFEMSELEAAPLLACKAIEPFHKPFSQEMKRTGLGGEA